MAKLEEHKHHTASDAMVEDAAPPKIADLIPDYGKPWYRVPHLLKLNALLLVPLLTSYVSGLFSRLKASMLLLIMNQDLTEVY